MSAIRAMTRNVGTGGEGPSVLFTTTSCVLEGIAIDYSGSASASTVLAVVDGDGATVCGITGNTDIGTVIASRLAGNGRLIAGTSTSNVRLSIPAFGGFSVNVTLDAAGPQVVTLYWRPLTEVSGVITTVGSAAVAAGGVQLVPGGKTGIFHAATVIHGEVASAATKDITFYNGTSTSGKAITTSGNNATNWTTDAGTTANRAVVTTTNRDEGLASVTTAAGAHINTGVLFNNGLFAAVAQGDSAVNSVSIRALVEF